jgi:hypothetical protein
MDLNIINLKPYIAILLDSRRLVNKAHEAVRRMYGQDLLDGKVVASLLVEVEQ